MSLRKLIERLGRRRVGTSTRITNEKALIWNNALNQREQEIVLLGEMSSQVQTCLTSQEIYLIAAEFLGRMFPAEAGALYMLTTSQNLVEEVAVWGEILPVPGSPVFVPDECWALRRGRMHFIDQMKDGLLCRHVEAAGSLPAAYLCVPLMGSNGALGVLHLQQRHSAGESEELIEHLSEFKQRLALLVAEYLALALVNLKLRETLREQTIRDPLTGLFNQRYMEETLERELYRAIRNESLLSLLMFDLDYFRRFNDTFGRDAGDAYLRALGGFLQSHIRGEDIACRYHDDQFVLILPETSVEVARQRAEQLQEEIRLLRVQHNGQLLEPVTMSLGIASVPEHGATVEAILQTANDYLVKPVETPVRLTVGPIVLNCYNFTVMIDEKISVLTPVEFELLYFLMSHTGQVFTAEQLLREVWHYPPKTGNPELVRVHIKNLRSKIEPEPKRPVYLRAIGRFGYSIRADEAMSQLSGLTAA